MKIKSVKAKYELQAAPKLKICFEIDQDEAVCESRCLSFAPDSDDYGLLGKITIIDEMEGGEVRQWEEKVDLKAKLSYGFLDELIESIIFQTMKKLGKDSNETIGGYDVCDPAVVWMTQKDTFKKVIRGWRITKTFTGEITGQNENGDVVRFDLGKSEFYVNEVLQPDGIIGSRHIINECYNDDHELCRQTEEMTFMEALDAAINGEKTC